MKLITTKDYLLLIDEEAEIKVGDYIYETDTLLINNVGKDYICNDKDFKIIAYYPLTSESKELDLHLLPNPFKNKEESYNKDAIIKAFYTNNREWKNRLQDYIAVDFNSWFEENIKGNKEYIQSLSTQQLPKEFIPEYINTNSYGSETNGYDCGHFRLKTITNSKDRQELVGTYKY